MENMTETHQCFRNFIHFGKIFIVHDISFLEYLKLKNRQMKKNRFTVLCETLFKIYSILLFFKETTAPILVIVRQARLPHPRAKIFLL